MGLWPDTGSGHLGQTVQARKWTQYLVLGASHPAWMGEEGGLCMSSWSQCALSWPHVLDWVPESARGDFAWALSSCLCPARWLALTARSSLPWRSQSFHKAPRRGDPAFLSGYRKLRAQPDWNWLRLGFLCFLRQAGNLRARRPLLEERLVYRNATLRNVTQTSCRAGSGWLTSLLSMSKPGLKRATSSSCLLAQQNPEQKALQGSQP